MKIFHNPRCSKSRQGLQILQNSSQSFEIVDYLKNPPTVNELKEIIAMLDFTPIQLVRKNEAIWKENFKGKTLSNAEIIKAMCTYPKLIERPILLKDGKAILGRPPENFTSLL